MAEKNRSNLYLLAIVGIVAVVGIVVMILNGGKTSMMVGSSSYGMTEDLTGQPAVPVVYSNEYAKKIDKEKIEKKEKEEKKESDDDDKEKDDEEGESGDGDTGSSSGFWDPDDNCPNRALC